MELNDLNLSVDTIKFVLRHIYFWDHFTANFNQTTPINFTISIPVAPVHSTISQSTTTFFNSSTFYRAVINY